MIDRNSSWKQKPEKQVNNLLNSAGEEKIFALVGQRSLDMSVALVFNTLAH